MNKDLFLALLAMDSYSRGYGEAIKLSGASLGGTLADANSSVLLAGQGLRMDVPAAFFAQAYTIHGVEGIADGTVVISYRGTDTSTFWDELR